MRGVCGVCGVRGMHGVRGMRGVRGVPGTLVLQREPARRLVQNLLEVDLRRFAKHSR